MAKLESGAPLEFCSLAYVPAMTRWQRKYDGVMTSATGALFNWKFIGYNEGLAQKAAGYTSMGEGADLIKKMAIREFGKANSAKAVAAWKQFDRAMDFHPFSRNSAGYFKGPFFIEIDNPFLISGVSGASRRLSGNPAIQRYLPNRSNPVTASTHCMKIIGGSYFRITPRIKNSIPVKPV